MKTTAVVAIHGMGSQVPGYSDALGAAIAERLSERGLDANRIAWQEIFWQDITERRQREYLQDIDAAHHLDYMDLREFVVQALGDAVAYRQVPGGGVYERIHRRIADSLGLLETTDDLAPDTPLIILAHSLGGHMFSNYIWDMQRGRALPGVELSAFQRGASLAGVVTFGCNIPLFTLAFDDVQAIEFPPRTLQEPARSSARWINLFDKDDVLGYPLRPTSPSYANVVDEDQAVAVGGVWSGWNPMAHTAYWADPDLARPVADLVAAFL
jgi:hypothetical protein